MIINDNPSDASKTIASVTWLSSYFLFSGLRDGRASPYQLNGGTKWVQYFFFDLRDDISYVQILYNAKWSYLCISDISAVLGNNNQKKIWFLDDNIWFDAVKPWRGVSSAINIFFHFFLLENRFIYARFNCKRKKWGKKMYGN